MPTVPYTFPAPAPGMPCQAWADTGYIVDLTLDQDLYAAGIRAATATLYRLTGAIWPGECSDRFRPCGSATSNGGARLTDIAWPSGWGPWSCGCATAVGCGCTPISRIRLPGIPVITIDSVLLDGAELDPARYRLDDQRELVWIPDLDDPESPAGWPCCQNLLLPTTEEGTLQIAYSFGGLPDEGGQYAAAAYGRELARAWTPSLVGECRLPKRITTISRQGVSMAVLDPMSLVEQGLTGLAEVDAWVAGVLLYRKRRGGAVLSPGRRERRRAG